MIPLFLLSIIAIFIFFDRYSYLRGQRKLESGFYDKLNELIRSGKVEFVVWNDKKQAVYLHTTALVASDRDEELALEAYAKKFGDFKPKGDLVEVYISPIGQLDENSTTQNMWHFVA